MVAVLKRSLRHLLTPPWLVRRAFPAAAMSAIETAIRETELRHEGQVRFAVEAALDFAALLKNQSPRERAIEVFSTLRVWDTEGNNGILIYVVLADRAVEIVADRGIHAKVKKDEWEQTCQRMKEGFQKGHYAVSVIKGIRELGNHLARHYPRNEQRPNELPDAPVVL